MTAGPIFAQDESTAKVLCQQLANNRVLGVDIETARRPPFENDPQAGLDPYRSRIRLVSVASPDGTVAVFDMYSLRPGVLESLAAVPWVAHNALFEWRHMTLAGFRLPQRLHDTQLMARPLHHRIMSLADLAEAELDLHMDKSLQRSDWSGELSRQQIEYAGADALIAVRLADRLLRRIDAMGLRPLYDLYRSMVPIVGEQILHGLNFNWDEHQQQLVSWREERNQLRAVLSKMMPDINLRSPKQISRWLTENLPSEVVEKWPCTRTGNLCSRAAVLQLHSKLPMVEPLLRWKRVDKLIGTYGEGYLKHRHPVTGRIHPDVMIAATEGGRFSCSRPNVQNPPRDMTFRRLFQAEPGRVLVAADFSQIELRVAALLSEDVAMLEAYMHGMDLHRVTAAALAGVSPEEISDDQRQAGKAVNFGNLYQQRPKGLAKYARISYGVEMSIKDASAAQQKFFNTYPDLRRWQLKQIQKACMYRHVESRLGLTRDFNVRQGYLAAEACNHPIQGSAGEVLMASLARLPQTLSGTDARVYNHIHDEIILDVAEGDEEAAKTALHDAMVQGFLQIFPEGEALTRDLVEVKSGPHWGSVK